KTEADQCQRDLQAGREKGLAKLLAQPKLVTVSGRVATFHDGGQQAVPEVNADGRIVGTRLVEFGTQLTFLPIVQGNGQVYLEVEPVISRLSQANGFAIG